MVAQLLAIILVYGVFIMLFVALAIYLGTAAYRYYRYIKNNRR